MKNVTGDYYNKGESNINKERRMAKEELHHHHEHHHHDLNEQFEEVFSGKKTDEEILAHQASHAHHQEKA